MRITIICAAVLISIMAWNIAHYLRPDVIPVTPPDRYWGMAALFVIIAVIGDVLEGSRKSKQ
jgi:hypothetical protein